MTDTYQPVNQSTSFPISLPVALILLSFVVLGIWFSLVIPPFETPDEHYHYAFARHLAQGNPLPVQAAEATGPWEQEGSQAPLYYWLVGRLTAGIDQSDFEAISTLNPRANMGDPLFPGNKNRMLYSALSLPLVGANLALHVGRWLSLLLGVITLCCLYATARLAFPRRPGLALVALATGAWLPQFVFHSASFTNDSLIITMAALTLLWLVRLAVRPADAPIQGWEWGLLGILLGLAALSKLQGLGLWLLAALTGGLIAWMRRDWRVLLRAALPVAVPALAIAGWWYWRNISLYGDWTGLEHLAAITGLRTSPLTWDGWWHEFRGLRYSSWGLFGWFNLLLPLWVYRVLDMVTVLALAGGIGALTMPRALRTGKPLWQAFASGQAAQSSFVAGNAFPPGWMQRISLRRPETRARLLLALWALISTFALLYWIHRAVGSQGRLIFPALVPLVIFLVAGLSVWTVLLPHRVRAPALAALPLFLLGCTLYSGGWILPAAYAAPPPVAAIPAEASPLAFRYGAHEELHLVAMTQPAGTYRPGDTVPVTLYMTAPQGVDEDYQLFIQLLDEQGVEVGNLTTHPGWGSHPTSLWTPGAIYADSYAVQVWRLPDERSPLRARIYVGFINPATEAMGHPPLIARDASGTEIAPAIGGYVTIYPFHPPDPDALGLMPVGSRFGEWITLHSADVQRSGAAGDDLVTVRLLWEALHAPPEDLTAFVHVLDEAGEQVAGHDGAPAGERYPTHAWQVGDRILSEFQVALPADAPSGPYQVWVGLYPAREMGATRVPVTLDGGQRVQHDRVLLAELP